MSAATEPATKLTTSQPARIARVIPNSIAAEIGFEPGDAIVAIAGRQPRDLIDYQFLCAGEMLEIDAIDVAGTAHRIEIEKDYDEDLGLEFETALFDGLIQCNNRCPFCFIDQQPPGKRESLYFKDDDYRLSFLYGSYLTLTNLPPREWQRIEQLRLSPLYVSVHATEPELRSRLLNNPRAARILEQLEWFQERRLQIHAQVVVCPRLNDGQHLERTLRDLARFGSGEVPAVASVAIVPVGLTRFRTTLDELVPVTPSVAADVIDLVQPLQTEFRSRFGSTFAWLADEWFTVARRDLPPTAHYEDYPQIGNGVGSIRQFLQEFRAIAADTLPACVTPPRRLTWVVGNAVEVAFAPLARLLNAVDGLTVDLVATHSAYWGQDITVTGLLTGSDLLAALGDRDLGDGVLLPSLMLKYDEPRFLDDMTVDDLGEQLSIPIHPVVGVTGLIDACLEWPPARS
ncbi:putative FeS-containing cyanobacterial-specific oxidoreductase [Rubidibacter lacunae KORDI 51-2]|uniref:Putative FeS-containing cyanobacterial-specific oxidoreductase n=1 Tax=Rubidibacter lacunae KORDI 51-2 TaxID=582515 RepID=U5DLY5_9CHRO|nr:TIGR03279 family radical SAM protein [Rubidibacter lacunae]ERN42676.1 putative FeS-containing cyanobacterial-specific oxidoreductase [Rubidibacter lacunae KORDI 51-2]